MKTNKIWFEGTVENIIELNEDLKKFPEDTINPKSLKAKLLYMEGCKKGSAFLFPLIGEEDKNFIVKNWEGNFKDFQTDMSNKITNFEYNEKIYHIYADKDTYQKRWQHDFEKVSNPE